MMPSRVAGLAPTVDDVVAVSVLWAFLRGARHNQANNT